MWSQLSTTEVAQWGTHSCTRPQPATDNGVRDGRYNCLVAPPTLMGSTSLAPLLAWCKWWLKIARLAAATRAWKRIQWRTSGTPGQRTACAATQSINILFSYVNNPVACSDAVYPYWFVSLCMFWCAICSLFYRCEWWLAASRTAGAQRDLLMTPNLLMANLFHAPSHALWPLCSSASICHDVRQREK